MNEQHTDLTSPLAGEVAAAAIAAKAGEGYAQSVSKNAPSPGSAALARDLATLSREGRGDRR